jgi:hypothetical protein
MTGNMDQGRDLSGTAHCGLRTRDSRWLEMKKRFAVGRVAILAAWWEGIKPGLVGY